MGEATHFALDIIYALTFVIATSLISVVWYRMSLPGVKTFIAMQLGVTFYAFGMFMEINSDTLDLKVFWNNVQVVSLGVIVATFPLFAITYAGGRTKRTYLLLTPLWALLAITLVVLWTNPWHHLYYLSFDLRESMGFVLLGKDYGPWAMAMVGVSFLVEVLGTLYVWRASKNWPHEKRQQSLVMMLAFIIPPIMGIFYVFLYVQIVDLVLVGFLISGAIVFVALYRFNLFELLPMADNLIFQSMEDAIIVSDTKGTIVQVNPSAAALIGRRAEEVVGWTSLQFLERLELRIDKDLSSKWEAEVESSASTGKRSLELRNSPIDIPRRGVKGSLIIIRDMTSKRRAEAQARIASDKLHILDSVTRHDIMNQSMAIAGYAHLLKEGVNDPSHRRYVDGILRSTESIRDECVFAKSYIDFGIKTPLWQKLDVVLINASASLSLGDAKLNRQVDDLEIFADPLLETVFHNLFDNSLRHGEKVKSISVSAARSASGWQIVVEDDGIGIPDELKERIFEEGFGKNTGLGLHLCRRILAITDISLTEEGRWGEGARFVMRVPSDRIRGEEMQ